MLACVLENRGEEGGARFVGELEYSEWCLTLMFDLYRSADFALLILLPKAEKCKASRLVEIYLDCRI